MPPVVVFIGKQRFKHVKRISKPARQIQVRTVAPVQGWTQVTNELPGHPTTEEVAGSHDPFGWNLPPTPSNWHDTPPKKGVPYAVLFGRDPIYVYDDDHHQAVPSPYKCPFHQLPLPHHVSKQGWAYVKCPVQPCAVFLDEKAAPTLLDQLRQQKHPQLMAGRGTADDPQPPLMCFCNEPLALRVSKISKNPGRLFLGCKSQKCAFFQWTVEPWSQSLRDRWAQVLRHLGP